MPVEPHRSDPVSVPAAARAEGPTDTPRIEVAFRPVLVPAKKLAWYGGRAAVEPGRHVLSNGSHEVSGRDASAAPVSAPA